MNFDEWMNIVYLLKLLYEADHALFCAAVDLSALHLDPEDSYYYDGFYEFAFEICNNLFLYTEGDYYESRGLSITVYSDPMVEDYFELAGRYGEMRGIPEEENPFLRMWRRKCAGISIFPTPWIGC